MTKDIFYSKTKINNRFYLIASTVDGLVFVGCQNGNMDELKSFFKKEKLVYDEKKNEPYVIELEEYLSGKRKEFDFNLDVTGTEFQMKVWQQLRKIPYGSLSNYSKIATQIGNPKAVRAVGTAIGRNPVSIIVPCHRVLSKNGSLGGYRGGLPMKRELLNLEKEVSEHV
ncbi:methylated-DNA-(protein)-cysteine S-methyltransferase [Companilactobacillus tucceti DSM 20183]|uniref:Methylated-DNA--protein-cysteine methyltransferase n=1 Tax=Companilactobacillus tucceti DSM 20183 TaxID=1423811 RepID=A0A0R1J3D6_9LACO|nr:methylated-DNA--[protein]-cysteine S-methyltransferase [Companilactobacillus tucceti]KRK65531.1 methylated-DNA-(protein)-cysteine S-methyltransferase [Companilactobacillus tucceti DSM 20183]